MNWVLIIIQLIMALPKIVATVKEIIALIKQHQSPTMRTVYFKNLRDLITMMRQKGINPTNLTELHSLRDQVKASLADV